MNQEEEDINDSQISTHEIAFALKVIICELQSFLKQTINVIVFVDISLNVTVSVVANSTGEGLHFQSENI